jgi:hypothetical protein
LRDRVSRVWRKVEPALRLCSATVIIGAATGALIGGVGGRLAMRILFLTSDESVKGLKSDDGFEIGRFTLSDTINLIVLTAVLGVIAALLYLVAQPFLAPLGRATVPAMAAFYGVLGGAIMVHRDGIDFKVLEPAGLAIALFVAICAGFGAVVAWLVDAAAREGSWTGRLSWWLLAPPFLLILFPPFAVLALAAAGFNRVATTADNATWRWRVVQFGALVVMTSLFAFGAVDLARDTASLA